MLIPKFVQHWDDERSLDHGVLVTLHYGWSFYANEHQGVMSFDTATEARTAVMRKNIYPCTCPLCLIDQAKVGCHRGIRREGHWRGKKTGGPGTM